MNRIEATAANLGRAANPLWARALPFAIYMVFLAITPLVESQASDIDVRWLYGAKVGVVAIALALLWRNFDELRPARLSVVETGWTLLAGIGVFLVWISLDLPWVSFMSNVPADGYDPRGVGGTIDWRLAAVRLTGAALIVPVMEELFWRSLVMRWVDKSDFLAVNPVAISLRALLVSSVIFGFEHQLWLAGIVAGLVYGELYRRSGNLWLPVSAHGVTNGALGIWVLFTGNWQFW